MQARVQMRACWCQAEAQAKAAEQSTERERAEGALDAMEARLALNERQKEEC